MIRKTVLSSLLIFLFVSGNFAQAASVSGHVSATIKATATVVPAVGVEAVDYDLSGLAAAYESDLTSSHLFYLYHPHVTAVQLTLETEDRLVAEFSLATAGHNRQSPVDILQSLPYQSLVAAEHEDCPRGKNQNDTCQLIVTIIYTEN